MLRIRSRKDFWAALLFAGFALVLAWDALSLPIGTARRMGPGYFPLTLAIILGGLALSILAKSLRGAETEGAFTIPVRGALFVLLSIVAFGLAIKPLGFLPAVAISIAICAFAAPEGERRPLRLAGLLAALLFFCWAVFIFGLRLPVVPFGPS